MKLIIDIPDMIYNILNGDSSWGGLSVDYILHAVKDGTPLEAQPMEVINKIPEDYVYDTETDEFEVYRHKYTGKEIHITKEPKLYKLESQPCEDCISREDVLSLSTEYAEEMFATTFWKLRDDIRALPPVMPQTAEERPKGKWIEYEVDIAPHPLHCSLCGFSNHHISNRYMREFRRCPNCGAEMEVDHE